MDKLQAIDHLNAGKFIRFKDIYPFDGTEMVYLAAHAGRVYEMIIGTSGATVTPAEHWGYYHAFLPRAVVEEPDDWKVKILQENLP